MNIADLLGKPPAELLALAPSATHQHAKGGLYRYLGPAMDTETKSVLLNRDGEPMDGWLHVYPFAQDLWIRTHSEFNRFRPLEVK